jgi:DNA-binding NarL/FixJ family response regulator
MVAAPFTFRGPALLCDAFRAMLETSSEDAGLPIGRPLTLLLKNCSGADDDEWGQDQPDTCVMVTRGDQADLLAATRLGVQIFVGFDDEPEVLWEAVRAASKGEPYCSRTLLPNLMRTLREVPSPGEPVRMEVASKDALSDREREIAALVAAGRSNEQVAQRLFISVATVKFHLGNIYRKLGIARRGQIHSAIPHPVVTGAGLRAW